jgi:hypothetical protein
MPTPTSSARTDGFSPMAGAPNKDGLTNSPKATNGIASFMAYSLLVLIIHHARFLHDALIEKTPSENDRS